MKQIFSLLLFGFIILFQGSVFASQQPGYSEDKESNYTYDVEDNYNFDDNSYYVSDEQLKDIEDINKIEDETTFETKIINSSHFSSGTATRTYIPINKKK